MSTVVLSTGLVTSADVLSVELVQSIELPDMIMIRWPGNGAPTVCQPARFAAAALAIIAVCDQAMIALKALDLKLLHAESPRGRGFPGAPSGSGSLVAA